MAELEKKTTKKEEPKKTEKIEEIIEGFNPEELKDLVVADETTEHYDGEMEMI